MAKLIRLADQITDIVSQIFEENRKANLMRKIENDAAIRIQSWYRGMRIRAYLKHLKKNAIVIQKSWRGFKGRSSFRILLQERVKQMKLDFFNQKACLVQKIWRGYYSRKYIFNYYKRKAYLAAIQQKNEHVLKELKEYKEYMDRQREERKNILKYKRIEEEAKRNHHLISTKQIPGVYNSPYKPAPDEMEYLMRSIKLEPTEKHDLYVQALRANKFEAVSLPPGLPPLVVKPQGPFRDPLDVRKQRYRPFSPSLRVETDYDGLRKARDNMKGAEWTERLHDDIFYPIDKSVYKKPYEPLMLTQSKYEKVEYGVKQFREKTNPDALIGGRFRTLVPPIPEFHKLNKTYVDAHYYLA